MFKIFLFTLTGVYVSTLTFDNQLEALQDWYAIQHSSLKNLMFCVWHEPELEFTPFA